MANDRYADNLPSPDGQPTSLRKPHIHSMQPEVSTLKEGDMAAYLNQVEATLSSQVPEAQEERYTKRGGPPATQLEKSKKIRALIRVAFNDR